MFGFPAANHLALHLRRLFDCVGFFFKLFFNDFFVLFLTRESRIGTRGWPLFYRNLPAFIELNRVLPGFTGFSSMSFLFER